MKNFPFQLIAKLLHPKYEEVCEVLGRKLPFLVTKRGEESFQTSFTVMKSTNECIHIVSDSKGLFILFKYDSHFWRTFRRLFPGKYQNDT